MHSLQYVAHILAGAVGILSGFIALYAVKGGILHRRSGIVFVYVMLATCMFGGLLAALFSRAPVVNIPAAALTAYLVVTALTTVRPPAAWLRRLDAGLMLVAFAVGLTTLGLGAQALANGGSLQGIPAFPFFMFAAIGLLAGGLDARLIRAGGIDSVRGAPRIARHLWRMTYALFVATMSFFVGQAKVFPKPLRASGVLMLPVVAVLVTLLYWIWRVRVRKSLRGMLGARQAGTGSEHSLQGMP